MSSSLPAAASACIASASTSQPCSPVSASASRRSMTVFGSSASCTTISASSISNRKPCNPSTTPSAQGCHPCLRYVPLPMSPVRTPYIRATCNPDADSWVAEFLAWWIDPETAFPIPERAGVLRYYVRVSGKIIWADQPEDLMQHLPPPETLPPGVDPPRPISVTFIPASVFDNPALLQVNPEYLAWLLSMPLLENERLLGGNWKIRPAAGLYFKRQWCAVVDEVPADLDIVRYWDLAATEKTELSDPDWTVSIKLGRD